MVGLDMLTAEALACCWRLLIFGLVTPGAFCSSFVGVDFLAFLPEEPPLADEGCLCRAMPSFFVFGDLTVELELICP